jgi:hypothetical protein
LIEGLASLTNYSVSYGLIGYLQFILISGPLSGLAVAILLHKTPLPLTRRRFLGLVLAWTAIGLLPAPFFSLDEITTAYIFAWALAGGLGGWATAAVMRRAGARLDRLAKWAIILGWAIGLGIGTLLFRENSQTVILLAFAAEGFVGGLATFTAWFRQGETKVPSGEAGPDLQAPAAVAKPESPALAPPADQIVAAPTASPAAGLVAALPSAIRPSLWLAAGWFLASLAAMLFVRMRPGGWLVELTRVGGLLNIDQAWYLITVLVAGLLSGAAAGIVLRRAGLRLANRRFLALVGGWTLAYLFTSFFAYPFTGGEAIVFGWFLAGALGGWVTYAVLRRAGARFDRRDLLVIALGWAAGLAIGEWLIDAIYWNSVADLLYANNLDALAENIAAPLFVSLGHGVAGFIGGLATFAAWYSRGREPGQE